MQLPWVICLVICAFNESLSTVLIYKNTLTHFDSVVLRGELLSLCIYVYESLCVQSHNIYLSYVSMNTCVCLAIS